MRGSATHGGMWRPAGRKRRRTAPTRQLARPVTVTRPTGANRGDRKRTAPRSGSCQSLSATLSGDSARARTHTGGMPL